MGKYTEKKIVLVLTELEADMLSLVAGNGWGDGDFKAWLSDPAKGPACKRAMDKLDLARRKAYAIAPVLPKCNHPMSQRKPGPRYPLVHGSAQTETCSCGRWRVMAGRYRRWRSDPIALACKEVETV